MARLKDKPDAPKPTRPAAKASAEKAAHEHMDPPGGDVTAEHFRQLLIQEQQRTTMACAEEVNGVLEKHGCAMDAEVRSVRRPDGTWGQVGVPQVVIKPEG